MKRYILLIFIGLSVLSCTRNYFNGIIESDIRLIPLVDTLNMEDFIVTNGTRFTGIYNNGNFIYKTNAENVEIFFYDVKTGIYCMKAKNSTTLTYWDNEYSGTVVSDIKVKRNDTTILGYLCDRIEYIETNANSPVKVRHIAYFNQSEFSVNPLWYTNMKVGGYNEIMKVTNAIPLLDIAEYPWIRFEYAATRVTRDTTVDITSIIKKYEDSFPKVRAY